MPKLSIIIPVRDEAPSMKRCFDSILSQSFQDWEIICVDDGSTDGSADILLQYIRSDKRIHGTVFNRHLGTVLARKLALLDARGDYVMFVDADDMLPPDACKTAVNLIRKTDSDIMQFDVEFEARQDDAERLDKFTHIFRSYGTESNGTNILYDCFVNHRFMHNLWNKIYRAEICKQAVAAMPDI
jgi:glycosyltransferase involved in cell wall biosynthesis